MGPTVSTLLPLSFSLSSSSSLNARSQLWTTLPPSTSYLSYPSHSALAQQCRESIEIGALGEEVAHLIASYASCRLDTSTLTSTGLLFSTSSSSHNDEDPLFHLHPPLLSPLHVSLPLPPDHVAVGSHDPDARRALIGIYDSTTFRMEKRVFMPSQESFVTPIPSISSLCLLPPLHHSTTSSLLAALDDCGHLCVLDWRQGVEVMRFDTRAPVFYALSHIVALPYSRLALLLSASPGPSHPRTRLLVFDLAMRTVLPAWIDDEKKDEFPLTLTLQTGAIDLSTTSSASLMYPLSSTPTPINSSSSPTTACSPPTASKSKHPGIHDEMKCSLLSLYSSGELSRYEVTRNNIGLQHILTHGPLAAAGRTDWQPLHLSSRMRKHWRWRHRSEQILVDHDGTIVRIEGETDSVHVFIGHTLQRAWRGKFGFPHVSDEAMSLEFFFPSVEEEEEVRESTKRSNSSYSTSDHMLLSSSYEDPRTHQSFEREAHTDTIAMSSPLFVPRYSHRQLRPVTTMRPVQRLQAAGSSTYRLHVSACLLPSSVLCISSHYPSNNNRDLSAKQQLVTVWQLQKSTTDHTVSAHCLLARHPVWSKHAASCSNIGAFLTANVAARLAPKQSSLSF